MVVAGPDGRRQVPASGFFADYLQTALGPADVLVEVRVPKLGDGNGWGYRYEKFQRVAQSWAIVGVAALVHRSGDVIEKARLGLVNMGATPLRATAARTPSPGPGRMRARSRTRRCWPPREPGRPATSAGSPTTGGTSPGR